MFKYTFSKISFVFFLFLNFSYAQVDVVYSDLVWSDEFDSNGITSINATKWHHQTQIPIGGNWHNGEQQHYTNLPTNSFVENGVLKIVAKRQVFDNQGVIKQFTSARLNSKFAYTYGRVDIRAKVPTNQGTWPALWLLGKNITEPGGFFAATHGTTPWPACGEIDIMEHGLTPDRPGYVQSAIHTPSSSGATTNIGGTIANNLGNSFHVYSMNWSPFLIMFLLDGVPFYTYDPSVKNASTWPFTSDQYLLLNIAMGGYAGNIPSDFNQATMEIDYVRVYQNVQVDTQIPTNFTATVGAVTSSSIELLLNSNDNSGSVVYGVTYGSNSTSAAGTSGVQKSFVITGLNPTTNYSFSVRASDLAGNNAANNPIILNATTSGVIGCNGTSSAAQEGSFSTGYNYAFETIGTTNVKVTFELLDTDKIGLVAFLRKQTPLSEVQMTNVSGRTFSYTLTGQTPSSTISYAVKFAYTNGLSVTQYFQYVVGGNNCNLGLTEISTRNEIKFKNPAHLNLEFDQNLNINNLKIYSLLGQKMMDIDECPSIVDISNLSKGVYFMIISVEDKIYKEKLVID